MKTAKISAVTAYVAEVAKLAKMGKTTEHSFRPAMSELLSALAPGLTPVNEAKRLACGAPDFILFDKNKLPVMFVETKDLGDGDLDGRKRRGGRSRQKTPNPPDETVQMAAVLSPEPKGEEGLSGKSGSGLSPVLQASGIVSASEITRHQEGFP